MATIRHFDEWRVVKVQEDERARWVTALPTYTLTDFCPACGADPPFYGHGTKQQTYRDLPTLGKATIVVVNRKRYRCRSCKATFMQDLLEMDDAHQATTRLVEYVMKEAVKRTFASVAQETGLNEITVRRLFKKYSEHLGREYKVETPRWLGMDEIYLIRTSRAVFTNLEKRTIIDMVRDRTKATLDPYIAKLENRHRVELVAIDMWPAYRDLAKKYFPNAIIVIDKFHVIKMGNEAVDKVRRALRKSLSDRMRRSLQHDKRIMAKREKDLKMDERIKLDTWILNFPDLGEIYRLKESFYAIYDCQTRAEAEAAFEAWKASVPTSGDVAAAFKPILTSFRNWGQYIFNYFDKRVTNAATEALNGLVRQANRAGRGYSFEAIRAKMLFRADVRVRQKVPRRAPHGSTTTFGMMDENMVYRMPAGGLPPAPEQLELDFGASISTLTELLEKDAL
jgi:transposase